MFCGSCMHDNALAKALMDAGYDTMLVPTYTPIRSDEAEFSVDQVFFGGINVYLQQKIPLFRHLPRFLDRVLDRPGLIRRVTSRAMETDGKMLGELTVSMLKGKDGNQRKEVRRLVDWLVGDAKPDVLLLSNILIAGFIKELKKNFDVPIVVTLQGDDIFLKSLSEPFQSHALKLIADLDDHIDGYLVHSDFYADHMSEYCGLSRSKMRITPLGLDTADYENLLRTSARDHVNIGYLARLSADKGLHNLISAFIELQKRESLPETRLQIAGWLGKDHEVFAEEQFQRLADAGLADRYQHLGSIERNEKLRMLADMDILCVPTDYHEPKGLYVLEALACGVPVVQPAHGVFPELIDDLKGGLLYESGNIDDLVEKLERLVRDSAIRNQLGKAGRQNVLQRRDGVAMAQSTIGALKEWIE